MEFLETLDTIRAEEASIHRLFGGEGDSAASVRSRTRRDPQYNTKFMAAVGLLEAVCTGKKAPHYLKEAMSTADFPLYLGDTLDRMLMASYQAAPASWRAYCKRAVVADFRSVKRFKVDGAEGVLPIVAQGAEYTEATLAESRHTYAVAKRGRTLPLLWELMINDDLGAFMTIPERFGKAAVRSEDKFATELHVDTNGPHASVYTVGNANIVTGNPRLTIASLQTAKGILSGQVDEDGEPIVFDRYVLEVGPRLEVTALSIANAIQLRLNENGGATNSQIVTTNWTQTRVSVVVNHYIPIVAATAHAAGSDPWFLHADPLSGRPAFEMGFLRGHESPEIFQKVANARRVGGGEALEDFDNDAMNYKVRHVFGGVAMESKCTVGSAGSA